MRSFCRSLTGLACLLSAACGGAPTPEPAPPLPPPPAAEPAPPPAVKSATGTLKRKDVVALVDNGFGRFIGPEPFPIPPYSRDWGEIGPREVLAERARRMMIEVEPAAAGPGALVLFRMKPRAIAKHVGILTGPDTFLHAYELLGVIEEPLTPSWRRRIAFAFLFPQR
jgi:NlpC/P60 family putative phage cell wall peptidase